MVVKRLDGVDRVIPVGHKVEYVRQRTHYFEQAVSIYSSSGDR